MASKSISFNESLSQNLICEQEKQDNNNMFLHQQHLLISLIYVWQYVGELNQQIPFVWCQLWKHNQSQKTWSL